MANQPYLVAARKHRPQRFSELVAQEHIAETLRNAIQMDRLAHVYLFSGPRGVGKTTTARILAKAVNCTGRKDDPEPCRECTSCRDLESQRSLNIFEIDAASNNKVDDVRELRDTVQTPPQGAMRKIYIIDEVHMLSNAAFNALLKTLEEPPSYALFIFATTEPHKVLPTILSRCQRFDFRRIPVPAILEHLSEICAQEGITADEESLLLIARKGDGALRDALSAFDQAVALCGTTLVYSELAAALRVVDDDYYFEIVESIAKRDTSAILQFSERVLSQGYDIREFLGGLAEHLRKLLVAVSVGGSLLQDVSETTRKRYIKQSSLVTQVQLLRMLMILDDTLMALPMATSPRLKFELALVKMSSLSEGVDLKEALNRLRRLEDLLEKGSVIKKGNSTESVSVAALSDKDTRRSDSDESPSLEPQPRSTESESKTKHQHRVNVKRKMEEQARMLMPKPDADETPKSLPPTSTDQPAASAPDNPSDIWTQATNQIAGSKKNLASSMARAEEVVWQDGALHVRIAGQSLHDHINAEASRITSVIREVAQNPQAKLSLEVLPAKSKRQQAAEQLQRLQASSPTVQALVTHFDVELVL